MCVCVCVCVFCVWVCVPSLTLAKVSVGCLFRMKTHRNSLKIKSFLNQRIYSLAKVVPKDSLKEKNLSCRVAKMKLWARHKNKMPSIKDSLISNPEWMMLRLEVEA